MAHQTGEFLLIKGLSACYNCGNRLTIEDGLYRARNFMSPGPTFGQLCKTCLTAPWCETNKQPIN